MEGDNLEQLASDIENLRKQKQEVDRYINELEVKERDGARRKFEEGRKRPRENERDAGRFDRKRERTNNHESEHDHRLNRERDRPSSSNNSNSADKPRMISTIVRVDSEKPRSIGDDSQLKQRNIKILGLINGTLQRFKKDLSEKNEARSRREEIEQKVEAQVIEESTKLREEHKRNLIEQREKAKRIREELREKEEERELRILSNQWKKQRENLSKFIKTKSFPQLYYLPANHTDETRALLEASAKETLGEEYSSSLISHSSSTSSTSATEEAIEDEKRNGEPLASEQLVVESSLGLDSQI